MAKKGKKGVSGLRGEEPVGEVNVFEDSVVQCGKGHALLVLWNESEKKYGFGCVKCKILTDKIEGEDGAVLTMVLTMPPKNFEETPVDEEMPRRVM